MSRGDDLIRRLRRGDALLQRADAGVELFDAGGGARNLLLQLLVTLDDVDRLLPPPSEGERFLQVRAHARHLDERLLVLTRLLGQRVRQRGLSRVSGSERGLEQIGRLARRLELLDYLDAEGSHFRRAPPPRSRAATPPARSPPRAVATPPPSGRA